MQITEEQIKTDFQEIMARAKKQRQRVTAWQKIKRFFRSVLQWQK
jgi:hypothetical protein